MKNHPPPSIFVVELMDAKIDRKLLVSAYPQGAALHWEEVATAGECAAGWLCKDKFRNLDTWGLQGWAGKGK